MTLIDQNLDQKLSVQEVRSFAEANSKVSSNMNHLVYNVL